MQHDCKKESAAIIPGFLLFFAFMATMTPNQTNVQRHSGLLLLTGISIFFTVITWLLWPYYQYYIDIDAISYLTLVKNYLAGNYEQAVNAFWSPMGVWLTAIWVKLSGWPLFASAIFVNAIGGWAALLSSQGLFNKFRKSLFERCCFGVTMALFWAYVVYIQSFTDIWQCFFLLCGLLVLLHKNFEKRLALWLLAGLLAALAYFSKAYSFYFFPLMILTVSGIKMKQDKNYRLKKHMLIAIVSIGVMLVVAAPWLYLLHDKYGFWSASTAGKLNLSWWLEGTQKMRPDIQVLVPPPYPGSLFYFEDPLWVQGALTHFWDSPMLFLKFIARIGFNALQWVVSGNRISPFYFPIWLFCIWVILQKGKFAFTQKRLILLIVVFLIFPLPYWPMTFDNGRYLWFTVPLSILLGLSAFDYLKGRYPMRLYASRLLITSFFLSFLVTPILDLKELFGEGENEYKMAQSLKALGIQGPFVSNLSYAEGKAPLHFIAWFNQSPWYCHTLSQFSTEEILADAQRYPVRYYFYFHNGTGDSYQLEDAAGKPYPELTNSIIPGLKVFDLGN